MVKASLLFVVCCRSAMSPSTHPRRRRAIHMILCAMLAVATVDAAVPHSLQAILCRHDGDGAASSPNANANNIQHFLWNHQHPSVPCNASSLRVVQWPDKAAHRQVRHACDVESVIRVVMRE